MTKITDAGLQFYLRELELLRPHAMEHYSAVAERIQDKLNLVEQQAREIEELKDALGKDLVESTKLLAACEKDLDACENINKRLAKELTALKEQNEKLVRALEKAARECNYVVDCASGGPREPFPRNTCMALQNKTRLLKFTEELRDLLASIQKEKAG